MSTPSLRRRVLVNGGALLAVGVVLTVAGAWACAAWAPTKLVGSAPFEPAYAAWWTRRAPEGFGDRPNDHFTQKRVGFGVEHLSIWAMFPRPVRRNPDAMVHTPQRRLRAGWPLPALEGVIWRDRTHTTWSEHILRIRAGAGELPLRPLWLGLLVDTVAVAAALALLGAIPLGARRLWRRVRGRCPGCGYPIGSSAVCTECGRRRPRFRGRHRGAVGEDGPV